MFDKKLELTKKEWMMALRVSCVLKFKSVNKLATKYLPDVDPITRLSFYKEYDVVNEEWVREALLQLVQRESPLSEAEAERIGIKISMEIIRLRHTCMEKCLIDASSKKNYNAVPWWDWWKRYARNLVGQYNVYQLK